MGRASGYLWPELLGVSGGMEAEVAKMIWQRSIEKYKLRYTEIVAHKTFAELCHMVRARKL